MTRRLLIILGGLPGTGKTTIGKEVARQLVGVYLRIDTIEYELRSNGITDVGDFGYRVAYAVAADNLRLGRTVVGDSVNALLVTRNAWRGAAENGGADLFEVEIICSDATEHRRRLEDRVDDIPGARVTWDDVLSRRYEPWHKPDLVIDTAQLTLDECVKQIVESLHVDIGR